MLPAAPMTATREPARVFPRSRRRPRRARYARPTVSELPVVSVAGRRRRRRRSRPLRVGSTSALSLSQPPPPPPPQPLPPLPPPWKPKPLSPPRKAGRGSSATPFCVTMLVNCPSPTTSAPSPTATRAASATFWHARPSCALAERSKNSDVAKTPRSCSRICLCFPPRLRPLPSLPPPKVTSCSWYTELPASGDASEKNSLRLAGERNERRAGSSAATWRSSMRCDRKTAFRTGPEREKGIGGGRGGETTDHRGQGESG